MQNYPLAIRPARHVRGAIHQTRANFTCDRTTQRCTATLLLVTLDTTAEGAAQHASSGSAAGDGDGREWGSERLHRCCSTTPRDDQDETNLRCVKITPNTVCLRGVATCCYASLFVENLSILGAKIVCVDVDYCEVTGTDVCDVTA